MFKFISFCLFLLFFTACSTKETKLKHSIKNECQVYSLKSAQCLSPKELVQQLEPYQIIFIGDHHNEDDLHLKVAKLIKNLSNSGVKVLFASEWFYPEDEKILTAFAHKKLNEKEFLKKIEWEKRLKYNKYSSFKPMYETIRETGGELYGINMPKIARKKISDQNLSAMSKKELSFNQGLDINVSAHKELIMPFLSHCHAPKKGESLQKCKERMYRVQVAWDSKMAEESFKLSQHLQKNEKLIVFAGAMHIETGLGIPLRFARLSNKPFVSIIPADESTKEVNNDSSDYLIFYEALPQE